MMRDKKIHPLHENPPPTTVCLGLTKKAIIIITIVCVLGVIAVICIAAPVGSGKSLVISRFTSLFVG